VGGCTTKEGNVLEVRSHLEHSTLPNHTLPTSLCLSLSLFYNNSEIFSFFFISNSSRGGLFLEEGIAPEFNRTLHRLLRKISSKLRNQN
jgi:hypothetical protein